MQDIGCYPAPAFCNPVEAVCRNCRIIASCRAADVAIIDCPVTVVCVGIVHDTFHPVATDNGCEGRSGILRSPIVLVTVDGQVLFCRALAYLIHLGYGKPR